jgi:hypothetical protein
VVGMVVDARLDQPVFGRGRHGNTVRTRPAGGQGPWSQRLRRWPHHP